MISVMDILSQCATQKLNSRIHLDTDWGYHILFNSCDHFRSWHVRMYAFCLPLRFRLAYFCQNARKVNTNQIYNRQNIRVQRPYHAVRLDAITCHSLPFFITRVAVQSCVSGPVMSPVCDLSTAARSVSQTFSIYLHLLTLPKQLLLSLLTVDM